MKHLTTQQEIEREEDEFELEDRFLEEAQLEAAERVGPNAFEYESLVDHILERKWEAYYQANDSMTKAKTP